jgi:large repetitive protein
MRNLSALKLACVLSTFAGLVGACSPSEVKLLSPGTATPTGPSGTGEPDPETDTRAPLLTVDSPSEGAQIARGDDVTVSGTASDDSGSVTVTATVGGVAVAVSGSTEWSFPLTTSALAIGPLAIVVSASDGAGQRHDITRNVTLTLPGAPAAVLSGTPASPTKATSLNVTVGGARVTQYKYRLDDAPFSAATALAQPITVSGLAEGAHTLDVLGGDDNGTFQADAAATRFAWTVDLTPPAPASLSGQPASYTQSRTLSVTVGGADIATYRYTLDGVPSSSLTLPVSMPITASASLSEAIHTLVVYGADAAGNEQVVPTTFLWTVDVTPPTLLLTGLPPLLDNDATPSITVSGVFTYSYTVTCDGNEVDVAVATSVSTPLQPQNLVDGECTLDVTGADRAGNSDSASHTWTLDTDSPNTNLSGLPSLFTKSRTLDVTVSGTNGAVSYVYSLDCQGASVDVASQSVANFMTHITASSIPDGDCTLAVTVSDGVNLDPTPETFSWSVDNTAPQVAISRTAPASSPTQSQVLSATVTTTDPVTTSYQYAYTLDCAGMGADTSATGQDLATAITASSLPEGTCTLTVTLSDGAANTASATSTWTIDLTPPAAVGITRATPSGSPTNVRTLSATFTTSDTTTTGYTYDYALDCAGTGSDTSNEGVSLSSVVTASGLPEGSCTLSGRVIDAVGNAATVTPSTWTIDSTAPEAPTSSSSTISPTSATTRSIELALSTPDAGFDHYDYTVTGAGCTNTTASTPTQAATPTVAVAHLASAGQPCVFQARTVDHAGNVSRPFTLAWVVDRVAPTVAANTPILVPTGATHESAFIASGEGVASIDYTVAVNSIQTLDGTVANGEAIVIDGYLDGDEIVIDLIPFDAAGNEGAGLFRTFTIDDGEPTVAFDPGSLPPWRTGTAAFSVTVPPDLGLDYYEYRTDGGAFDGSEADIPYSAMPSTISATASAGTNTLSARATSLGAQTQAVPTSYTFTLDTTAPITSVSVLPSDPTGTITEPVHVFTVSRTDFVKSYTYTLTRNTVNVAQDLLGVGVDQPLVIDTNAYGSGAYELTLTATDDLGQTGNTVTYNWNI